jgi:hypothetical protein
MIQFLFLLLFASNSLAASVSQDLIASEQSFIVEQYSSFNKVEAETDDTDSIASNEPSFARTGFHQYPNIKTQACHKQRPYSLYSSRAPPVSHI